MVARVNFVALIGKQNNPLSLHIFPKEGCNVSFQDELKYNFLAHMSLDVFAARLPQQVADLDFGLLFVHEEIAVYGYMTNTAVKIVVGLSSGDPVSSGAELRPLLKAIHRCYVSVVCNPFYVIDEKKPIHSPHFDAAIKDIVSQWNA